SSRRFQNQNWYIKHPRVVAEKLLWNLSIKDQEVAEVSLKSPYDVIAKSPKKGDFTELCPGEDLNLHVFRHTHLKRAWLPVTAPGQVLTRPNDCTQDPLDFQGNKSGRP